MKNKICVFGGGSLYRLPIYNEMSRRFGCDFHICEDDPKSGIKTYNHKELDGYSGSFYPRKVFSNFFWLRGAIKLFFKDYDVYVVGGPFGLTYWLFILFSFFSKKRIASWSHGMYGRETGVRKRLKVLFYNLCSMNFVYNERAKQLMVENGISEQKICTVYNSMDTVQDLKIRAGLQPRNIYKSYFNNDYPIAIFVGRVIKDKKLEMLVQAMSILKKQGNPINFFVVGKDVDGVNLKQVAIDNGVENEVYMYGPCYDNATLGDFYYNADICITPGAIGLTAISSLTFGCPVITHDDFSHQGPEFESVERGVTGDFFKASDVNDLASVITKWFSIHGESDREQIRQNAYSVIDSKWNIYSECDAFEKGFEKLKRK